MNIIGANKAAGERLPIPDRRPFQGMVNHAISATWCQALYWDTGDQDWYNEEFEVTPIGNVWNFIEIMWFLSDFPALVWWTANFNTPANAPIPRYPTHPEGVVQSIGDDFAFPGNAIYTPDSPSPPLRDQATKGRSLTNNVQVSGYPMLCSVNNRGYLNGSGQPLKALCDWYIVANSAVVHGPGPSFYSDDTYYWPFIVREDSYNQAIADAGNLITYTFPWNQQAVFPVVGIYQKVPFDFGKAAAQGFDRNAPLIGRPPFPRG